MFILIYPAFSMKENIFNILQLVLAILLVTAILLQQKGTGLSGVFGGSSNIYSTKRGVDKILHYSTIAMAAVFFGMSLLRLVI
jgi:protein translocase SecG subunit